MPTGTFTQVSASDFHTSGLKSDSTLVCWGDNTYDQALPFSIYGNAWVAGVTLSYTIGIYKTATANGNGNYTITVPTSWSGTVTPSETGYLFSPVNHTFTNVITNQTNQNFTATQIFHITSNAGIAGATLNYTGGFTVANGSGNYTIIVPSGWSGMVTPSMPCYNFSPTNRSYTNILADQSGQDYTATALTTCKMIYLPLVMR